MSDEREHLLQECKRIKSDSEYTAEAHFQLATASHTKIIVIKFIPAILSAISGIGMVVLMYNWLAWLAVISSVVFAIQAVIDFDKECTDHTNAGKLFTTLKHESRSLYETFHHELDRCTLAAFVGILRERYNSISNMTPKTTDKAFEKSRKKIKAGKHEPEFGTES